jgi:hypothetical protein
MPGNRPSWTAITTTCSSSQKAWTPTRYATTTVTRWLILPTSGSRRTTATPSTKSSRRRFRTDDAPSQQAHDADEGGALEVVSDYDLDRIDPTEHGRVKGQIDGTPEDGDSFFNVER